MDAALVFIPAILSGMTLVHLLWPDRTFWNLVLKAFLGVGIGLGLRSLLHFLYLLVLPAHALFIYVDLATMLGLLIVAIALERRRNRPGQGGPSIPRLSRTQQLLVLMAGIVFGVSLLATSNYLLRRRQGDWDAWMMYNRAARFVYRDQVHWRESFSPRMDPIFHADYPLLLAMNIVAGWEVLGRDTTAVPLIQSGVFALSCVGLTIAALGATKSIGQAALGITLLWGVPIFVNEGARQMADVPMAYYLLATGVLFFLYVMHGGRGLLILAGVTAGLAAWTKNEGSVLVVGAATALVCALMRRRTLRPGLSLAAGLAAPLSVLLYFRLFLAPSGDILGAAISGSLSQVASLSRQTLILQYVWTELSGFGNWGIPGLSIGIIPVLGVYYLLFRSPVKSELKPGFSAGFILLGIQLLGYYAAYLVSPYELAWHLSYSSTRVVLQLFPLLLFLTLCASQEPESILASAGRRSTE